MYCCGRVGLILRVPTYGELAKIFGPFLSHLAEVIEEKSLARKLPTMTTRQSARVSDMNDKTPDATLPAKEEELDVSGASDEDQDFRRSGFGEATTSSFEYHPTLTQQPKSETVSDTLNIEYLQSLALCTCGFVDQWNICLERGTNQDNFQSPIPKGKFANTRNEGGLVHRSKGIGSACCH